MVEPDGSEGEATLLARLLGLQEADDAAERAAAAARGEEGAREASSPGGAARGAEDATRERARAELQALLADATPRKSLPERCARRARARGCIRRASATRTLTTPHLTTYAPARPASRSLRGYVALGTASASAPLAAAAAAAATVSSPGALRGALGRLVDLELTLLGILSQLASQLASGKWSHVVRGLARADPLSAALVWRQQRAAAAARRAHAAYFDGRDLVDDAGGAGGADAPSLWELRELLRAGAHACAAYGALADAFARRGAGFNDLLRGGIASTSATLARSRSAAGLASARAADALAAAAVADAVAGSSAAGADASAADAATAAAAPDAEVAAAALAAGIPCADILSACWAPGPFQPCAYVALDRAAGWVVLAVRGTLSGHDTLTDACAAPVRFLSGWAHAGMAAAAWQLVRTHLPAAAGALAKHPGTRLVLTGHSMGGGVAALAAALCASDDADVAAAAARGAAAGAPGDAAAAAAACAAVRAAHAVAFACPCVASLPLAAALRCHVTSLVAGKDVVPRLSVAAVQRLSWRLAAAWRPLRKSDPAGAAGGGSDDDEDDASAAAGASAPGAPAAGPEDAALWRGGAVELRDLRSPDLLCPAGRCLHLRRLSSAAPCASERSPAAFSDIQLSARMLSDHLPSVYVHALERIIARVEEAELMAAGDAPGARAEAADEEIAAEEAPAGEAALADAAVLAMLL
jgi:hypothetical protein